MFNFFNDLFVKIPNRFYLFHLVLFSIVLIELNYPCKNYLQIIFVLVILVFLTLRRLFYFLLTFQLNKSLDLTKLLMHYYFQDSFSLHIWIVSTNRVLLLSLRRLWRSNFVFSNYDSIYRLNCMHLLILLASQQQANLIYLPKSKQRRSKDHYLLKG